MWIEKLKASGRRDDILPFKWISWMLEPTPSERPTAGQLLGHILDTKSDHNFFCSHCLADAHSGQAGNNIQNGFLGEPPLEVVTKNLIKSFLQGASHSQSIQESECAQQDDHTRNLEDDAVTTIIPTKSNTWEPSNEGSKMPDANFGVEIRGSDRQVVVEFAQLQSAESNPERHDIELREQVEPRSIGQEELDEHVDGNEENVSSPPTQNATTGDDAQDDES